MASPLDDFVVGVFVAAKACGAANSASVARVITLVMLRMCMSSFLQCHGCGLLLEVITRLNTGQERP